MLTCDCSRGVIQLITLICSLVISFFPDEFDRAADLWQSPASTYSNPDPFRWPTDISRDVFSVNCHSHNDYWRRVPLYAALQAGCTSVEADVWLFDDELYVGHEVSSLSSSRTLRSLYVNPLLEILGRQNPETPFTAAQDSRINGVFDTNPSQTVILLIDFKTDGAATWPHVYDQLSPLRERGYLSHFNGTHVVNGPLTIVATGNAPFSKVAALSSTHRDIFFDAPLDQLADEEKGHDFFDNDADFVQSSDRQSSHSLPFNYTNSYYASASYTEAVGIPFHLRPSRKQLSRLRQQIRGAHHRGLKVRYWNIPDWPHSLRNHLWSVLLREGVDMLNVDDLVSATREEWVWPFAAWKLR